MKKLILFISFLLSAHALYAQSVCPLVSGITIDSVLQTKPGATKIAIESVSGHLFYHSCR